MGKRQNPLLAAVECIFRCIFTIAMGCAIVTVLQAIVTGLQM